MRIVQVLRNRLMCGPGAALTVRKLPGSAWIDLTARGSSQTGVKNAQNEANGNRRLTLWLQRSSVRWLRPFPRRTDPTPGRRGRDIDGLAMPEAVTKTSSAHLGSGGSKCLQRDGTARKLVGARQLVRQDGGRVAHFTVRNRCNLPRRAHQLASAYGNWARTNPRCGCISLTAIA